MQDSQNQLPAYRLEVADILKQLSTTSEGLESHTAHTLLEQNGPNKLEVKRKIPWWVKYGRQFKDRMIILLLVSSLIAFYLDDARTGIVLIALVLFNTIIGFTQEYKAERIMESLDRLVVSTAKVKRDGVVSEIASTDLVVGDIVYIEEGDSVPADLRLIEESELSTNDFALTGESNPSRKFTHALDSNVELGDRHNIVFMGTTVATGHGYGAVVGTGMHTELGRIANLSQDTYSDVSPLQRELNNIAARVTQGTVVLCTILLPIAIHSGLGIKDAFLYAIGIASSIIPQGLPAEINTSLAQAAKKLARARALVKKLSAVETLGATSIICTDKTGTLTKNQMTVVQFTVGDRTYSVSGTGYEANGTVRLLDKGREIELSQKELQELDLFLSAGVFASNARVNPPDHDHPLWYTIGDPTEGALIVLGRKAGLDPLKLEAQFPELKEFAFDSVRKRMSSIRRYDAEKAPYVFVKGAPESMLERCTHIWEHGKVRKLEKRDRERITQSNEHLATQAMRNLIFAYKKFPESTDPHKLTMDETESDLTYLGLVSMVDPLREEVPEAMHAAHAAHIKIAIVTGDYATTAQAIAQKAGLGENGAIKLVTGLEVRDLSDDKVTELVEAGNVIFSRVSPEDKLRIVGLAKESGHIVAVTGDGINDAPALKRADIGVAMGITGTDVAKQSAEIVLLDDSFHTLVGAIQQGRVVFQNIKKGTLSCFTSNFAELIVNLTSLGATALFHIPLALSVMEILAIDLIAELFPIAALGWDTSDGELMQERPRNVHDHILNPNSILDLLWCGILIGSLSYFNFIWLIHRAGFNPRGLALWSPLHMKATALTYTTIVLCQLGNILQRRSRHGLFTRYQLQNKQLWLAILLSLFCIFNVIYNPWISPYFRSAPIGFVDWLYALGAAAIFLLIREVQRRLAFKKIA